MKLGVAGIVSEWDRIDLPAARRVKEFGFRGASIFFSKPLEADLRKVGELKKILDIAGVEPAQANGAYEALVNPDDGLRSEGVRGLQALVRAGKVLNTPSVYVRPDNHTTATFDRLVDSLRRVAKTASEEGMVLGIEGHVLSALDTPQRMRDLLDAVASPALKFNIDPVNFYGSVRDVHDTTHILNELFDLLGHDIIAAHCKDLAILDSLVLHIDEVVIGEGRLDYSLFLHRLNECCPDIYCLIEHLPEDKIPRARTGLLDAAKKAGVNLEY
jgi:sugar phosphate isomerase/epimerase